MNKITNLATYVSTLFNNQECNSTKQENHCRTIVEFWNDYHIKQDFKKAKTKTTKRKEVI